MQQLFKLADDLATELPQLRLGLAGFDDCQCTAISNALGKSPPSQAAWALSPFQLADAWLLCGEKTAPSPNCNQNTLLVSPSATSERALRLNLSEITRPLAFSLPLVSPDIEARLTFTPNCDTSLLAVLSAFEQWLHPLRAKFMLGSQLMQRGSQLKRLVYHVSCRGQLLAILDFANWRIGILPQATFEQFETAQWETRPAQANAMPAHFVHSSVEQLRWIYAQHTQLDVLPQRYHRQRIYFSQTPNVPQTWLERSHLLLLRELSARPSTLNELAERCGLASTELARDLACLYFAGSLTTTAEKAATRVFNDGSEVNQVYGANEVTEAGEARQAKAVDAANATTRPALMENSSAANLFNSTLPPNSGDTHDQDLTAPAGLQRH